MGRKAAITEFRKFIQDKFSGRNYFCFVFGSHPLKEARTNSDLDFLVVADQVRPHEYEELANFTADLLKRHGLRLDDNPLHDVSYRRKLLVTRDFLERAIEGRGFVRSGKSGLSARKIAETPTYLNSDEFVMRLVLNAITSKGQFLCGNKKEYNKYQDLAWKKLVGYVGLVHGHSRLRLPGFVEQMFRKGRLQGEDFLGYKRSEASVRFLAKKAGRYIEKRRRGH
jgi:predicted nucleotidyltransferase